MPAFGLGPLVISALQFQLLLPVYFTLNALLIADRGAAELTMRNAMQWARIVTVLAEVLWSAYVPSGLHLRACAAAAVASAALHGANVSLAFAGPSGRGERPVGSAERSCVR